MKVTKRKQQIVVLYVALFGILVMLNGCQKEFWDYDCVWVSEEPYIYMPAAGGHDVSIEIDGIMYELIGGWKNDGTGITFYDPDIDGVRTEESIVWETNCEIKNGELYLTIIKDNVSNYDGKTIVLHQQPLESIDETVSSDGLTSEADTTETVEESVETESATSPIISCDDFDVNLLSKETIGDDNIYTFGVDNFHYYSAGVAFFYADDTKEEDIGYVLDNGKLIRMNEEVIDCGAFVQGRPMEKGDELNSLIEEYNLDENAIEDFIVEKFESENNRFYSIKEPELKNSYVKAIDDDRLLIFIGSGWQENYFEYSRSTGTVKELFEGLEEWCHGIYMTSFSENMSNAVICVEENSYDSGYYYVDLVNNTYTNIEDHFGIELNWFKEEAYDAADTDFMWVKDNTYLIMSQSDEVYTLYKCDFDADTIEILGENLLEATTVIDTTYKSRKAILTINSDGELVIQNPSQGLSATLDRKITDTFGYGLLDENDGIIYTMNDIAMIVDWDNGSITEIDAGKLEGWKSVRYGNDIYVFENREDLE